MGLKDTYNRIPIEKKNQISKKIFFWFFASNWGHTPTHQGPHISIQGVKFKNLLRETRLYQHKLQTATTHDHIAIKFLEIQVVQVILPPPHL